MKKERPQTSGSHFRVRRPLVVKLIGIISIIVVTSMGLVSFLSWWLYSADAQARAEENNLVLSEVLAAQVEGELERIHGSVLSLVEQLGSQPDPSRSDVGAFFDRNPGIAMVSVPGRNEVVNQRFFLSREVDPSRASAFVATHDAVARARAGETVLINVSPGLGTPSAALFSPYQDMGTSGAMVVVFSSETLQALVQTKSVNFSFLVDSAGQVIAYPDPDLVNLGASLAGHPLVSALLKSTTDNLQIRYQEPGPSGPIESFGAFRKLTMGQVGVGSTMPLESVYAAALRITRQNLLLTGVILVVSILAVWFFARSVTRPILRLVQAARSIKEGQFELDLRASSPDELGLLTESFVHMGQGLAERERVKETFGKFVNKDVAEQALKGNLQLGGTRRVASIFFSDIRSFTALSETMEPEAVVEFLNAYMTRMVTCLESTGGVVDKFIGDAIMGVWGAPITRGSPQEDALAAVEAMMLMRQSLIEYNTTRGRPGRPIIKIGCGLNTGPCLAGQIGSLQRMEYTVIGDAVNLASRIEALNKPFGTDILISQNTYDLVSHKFLTQAMPPIKVKGKTDPLQIYAVVNHRGAPGPQTLQELRTLLDIPTPEGEIDADQEEKKYEILPR